MKYITGLHALNIQCNLNTGGDWHADTLNWSLEKIPFKDSEKSVWGDYGIEKSKKIRENDGLYNVANHIRACLDFIEDGKLIAAKGMRRDYICDDKYMSQIFEKVSMLKNNINWHQIDNLIGLEYYRNWLDYKKEHGL
jgi:hypothetical protein